MAQPIWKDYEVNITTPNAVYCDFTITDDTAQAVIYQGRAYARPDGALKIKINDICADYIYSTFPTNFPTTGAEAQQYSYSFTIDYEVFDSVHASISTGDSSVDFYYDWSYDYARVYGNEPILSAPILRTIPRNAPLVFSTTNQASRVEFIDLGAYNPSFSVAFDIAGQYTLSGTPIATNVVDLSAQSLDGYSIARVTSGTQVVDYRLVEGCYRYMLYYLNAYGGWDFLLVEGKDVMTDKYTRHTLGKSINNSTSRARATRNYRNDIARKWLLHTLIIDDAGAENMHHLLGSVDVYLYDLQEAQLYPITIDNAECVYKTYSNQGGKLNTYDIEVSLAAPRTRR